MGFRGLKPNSGVNLGLGLDFPLSAKELRGRTGLGTRFRRENDLSTCQSERNHLDKTSVAQERKATGFKSCSRSLRGDKRYQEQHVDVGSMYLFAKGDH